MFSFAARFAQSSGLELRSQMSLVRVGPHGFELVEMTLSEDKFTATKLTGDPNVPAGALDFQLPDIADFCLFYAREYHFRN